jgi:tRNA dimethylallyltransferase
MKSIPIICGPTACGKTALALSLATEYPIEIVSADSRQLVKYLNIGTAKPTIEERSLVPFHLIDLIEPGERYSAFRFINDASRAIEQIIHRDHIPVIVGGTGLYLRALTDGVVETEEQDMNIRQQLEEEYNQLGAEVLHNRLSQIDPVEAVRIHPNNRVRVIRALEIFMLTGKTKSELTATGTYRKSNFDFEYFCLTPKREYLYKRINDRVDFMVGTGLIDEIRLLIDRGLKEGMRKANIIGYNEILDYLEGKLSFEEAVSFMKQSTRHYAKRQMTWFRKQKDCKYFSSEDELVKELRLTQ